MVTAQKESPIRPTTPEAINLAKTLLRSSTHGAIAVLDAQSRRPLASRVAVATDTDGTPIILISALASHTPGLIANPSCSLLLGQVGKGDPLAHPRITLLCQARQIDHSAPEYARIRRRYLNHNPKAELYVGLGDFSFFCLEVEGASLNGGFGKAFNLVREDLICPTDISAQVAEQEESLLAEYNDKYRVELNNLAAQMAPQPAEARNWKLTGIDPDGINLVQGDNRLRLFFSDCGKSNQMVLFRLYNMINK
ncbi:HugZ family protein [Daeguia caeni]|uniref:HugZ family protein n=1 Tax=Daeguia caeni TaxID=439612 RepID=A0ABV9H8D3_9HYPH